MLEFNQYQRSDKAPFIIYADLECLIEKIDGCKNIPENSFITKISMVYTEGKIIWKSFVNRSESTQSR